MLVVQSADCFLTVGCFLSEAAITLRQYFGYMTAILKLIVVVIPGFVVKVAKACAVRDMFKMFYNGVFWLTNLQFGEMLLHLRKGCIVNIGGKPTSTYEAASRGVTSIFIYTANLHKPIEQCSIIFHINARYTQIFHFLTEVKQHQPIN